MPRKVTENSRGGSGISKAKTLKGKYEEAKQEFQRDGRGETKNLPWGGYGYFQEQPIEYLLPLGSF